MIKGDRVWVLVELLRNYISRSATRKKIRRKHRRMDVSADPKID